MHQLNPELFLKAAQETGFDDSQVRIRGQEGYEHSYLSVTCFLPTLLSPDRLQHLVPIT